MRKMIITAMLCISTFIANAQVATSAYDSLQDKRMIAVQMHLERFHSVHSTGSALWFIGLGIVIVGIEGEKTVPVYTGAALNFLGTMLMIGSHKNVKRAAFVGRTDYNLQ